MNRVSSTIRVSSKKYTVYALVDPRHERRNDGVRYIGITKRRPASRLWQHIYYAKHGRKGVLTRNHRENWIRSLIREGVCPEIVPLEETDDWGREQWWIIKKREHGCKLVNGTNGGEGSPYNFTPEHRAKISAAKTGMKYRPMSAASRKNMGRPGRKVTPETRVKIAGSLKGKPLSPERREKIRQGVIRAQKRLG